MRWVLAVVMACTSSDPAPPRDSGCVLDGGMCSSAAGVCCAQRGTLFDEARGCRTALTRTIGCSTNREDQGCVMTGIPLCVITHQSGVRQVWLTPGQTTGWTPEEGCSEETRALVAAAKPCG